MSEKDNAPQRRRAEEEGKPSRSQGEDALAAPTESFKQAFEQLETDVRVAEDKYLRALADLDNTRKHLVREKSNWLRFGHEDFVRDLLPILDNLERAIQAAAEVADGGNPEEGMKGLLEGVALTIKQFRDTLAAHGVTPVESEGSVFDPRVHEAVQRLDRADVPPGTVVEEFLKGYQLHERLLRPAKVVVSGGSEDETEH
ncbi:MAG: nucleotide exchange factor GrpE [Deltaproteobacteria bacterium]|nr:nucleotide exchange factor GrpE [Deltaproteobacteria bacterium]